MSIESYRTKNREQVKFLLHQNFILINIKFCKNYSFYRPKYRFSRAYLMVMLITLRTIVRAIVTNLDPKLSVILQETETRSHLVI